MRLHLATLVDDFRAHAAETAVVSHRGIRRYATTYGQVATLAGRFAAELERQKIAPGERVVLWGENSAEWIAAFFGCLLRGVLAVPLDASGSVEFAQRVIAEVAPKLIAGDHALLRSLQTQAPVLALDTLSTSLPQQPDFSVDPAVTEDAPFQIVFTSGTTSEPKGIVHTHRNVLASLRPIENEIAKYRKYERWFHPLRFLHTLPLSHVFGQFMGLWLPGILAAEVHFPAGSGISAALEPTRNLELIHRERISVLIAVPRVLELLRAHLLHQFPALAAELDAANKLSALKRWWHFRKVHRVFGWKFWAVISGGASLPAELERFWNRLGFALIQGYGMTETAALVTLNHPFKIAQGTIGKALPGREVKLSDTGEILVRGDMVSAATWQHGTMQAREGEWLATGDLGEQTGAGDLRFMGRKGEAIVTSAGLNIYPADLEAAMLAQPNVRGCVVVGCELPGGIEPVCVVRFSGDDAALQQAVLAANAGLSEYQHIRRVLRWTRGEFPYTSTGKLLRRKVRDWACAELRGRADTASIPTDPLLALIAGITGEPAPSNNDTLRLSEDLHLDSLGRVQLASSIEQRFGLELTDEQLSRAQTLGDLRALLEQNEAPHSPAQNAGPHPSTPDTSSLNKTAFTPAPHSTPAQNLKTQNSKLIPTPHSSNRHEISRAITTGQHVYPHWPWTWLFAATRVLFLEAIMRPLVWLLGAPRIITAPQPPPSGPLLLIANHVTAIDPALVLFALPFHLRRRVAIAMSGEILLDMRHARNQGNLFLNALAPPAYWLITWLFNVFPLPRLQGVRRSFAHAGEAMDRGYSVLVFPEGARSRTAEMQPFRPGIGLLAEQAQVPVLPVALLGLHELSTRRKTWLRSGRLEVRVGNAIPPNPDATPAERTAALESALRELLR